GRVAGGWALRASREAAEACGRMFERPVERGLSGAALETLAIVAYLGPVSRPEIARIRGVAADSVVAGLVERGLIAESGREDGIGGASRYRPPPALPLVAALRARVRPRPALGAPAPGRPRREHRADPRAARVGRRAPTRLEPSDDRLGLVARERAQRFRVLGAVALELHQDQGGRVVVRRLDDLAHL